MRKAFLFASLCLVTSAVCGARQSPAAPKPHHTKIVKVRPPDMIDGAEHPEQIPDLVAYRLFFVQVTLPAQAVPDDSKRHEAMLGQFQLSDADRITLELAIANFHDRYAAFLQQYKTVTADDNALAERDSITQDAINYLRNFMSASGFSRVNAFMQKEKKHMKRVPTPKMQ